MAKVWNGRDVNMPGGEAGSALPGMTVGDVLAHKLGAKKAPPVKIWMGSTPTSCDLCGCAIDEQFVDGKTVMGPWGMLCLKCHREHGVGLGTGRGQRYRYEDGRWVKKEG